MKAFCLFILSSASQPFNWSVKTPYLDNRSRDARRTQDIKQNVDLFVTEEKLDGLARSWGIVPTTSSNPAFAEKGLAKLTGASNLESHSSNTWNQPHQSQMRTTVLENKHLPKFALESHSSNTK